MNFSLHCFYGVKVRNLADANQFLECMTRNLKEEDLVGVRHWFGEGVELVLTKDHNYVDFIKQFSGLLGLVVADSCQSYFAKNGLVVGLKSYTYALPDLLQPFLEGEFDGRYRLKMVSPRSKDRKVVKKLFKKHLRTHRLFVPGQCFLEGEQPNVQVDVDELAQAKEQLEEKIDEAEEKLEEVNDQVSDAEEELEEVKDDVKEAKEKLEKVEGEVDKAEDELKEVEKEFKDVVDDLEDTQKDLEKLEGKVENTQEKLDDLRDQVKDAKE